MFMNRDNPLLERRQNAPRNVTNLVENGLAGHFAHYPQISKDLVSVAFDTSAQIILIWPVPQVTSIGRFHSSEAFFCRHMLRGYILALAMRRGVRTGAGICRLAMVTQKARTTIDTSIYVDGVQTKNSSVACQSLVVLPLLDVPKELPSWEYRTCEHYPSFQARLPPPNDCNRTHQWDCHYGYPEIRSHPQQLAVALTVRLVEAVRDEIYPPTMQLSTLPGAIYMRRRRSSPDSRYGGPPLLVHTNPNGEHTCFMGSVVQRIINSTQGFTPSWQIAYERSTSEPHTLLDSIPAVLELRINVSGAKSTTLPRGRKAKAINPGNQISTVSSPFLVLK
ncbi:hypothetical protein BDN71DRAFT_1426882 [Pleurotus eryngii]|uniref:Uncharacterized protein n=1 Tax=Pleurotus eryngii TaxID=5323 RepID=A0A9P6A963_PLEER|nr:hypothetical protein BDN71DRAFT_1426882 [Pleurotus eryngii]